MVKPKQSWKSSILLWKKKGKKAAIYHTFNKERNPVQIVSKIPKNGIYQRFEFRQKKKQKTVWTVKVLQLGYYHDTAKVVFTWGSLLVDHNAGHARQVHTDQAHQVEGSSQL